MMPTASLSASEIRAMVQAYSPALAAPLSIEIGEGFAIVRTKAGPAPIELKLGLTAAGDGSALVTILDAKAAGFGAFGLVRRTARATMLSYLRLAPQVLTAEETKDANIRVRLPWARIAAAKLSGAGLAVALEVNGWAG